MKAKKSLGQHFLNSKGVVAGMVKAADLRSGETVLEIGPGKGILTGALLERGARVLAVEKDERMIKFLGEKFPGEIKSGRLKLVNEDILEFDFSGHGLKSGNYKLAANIPYYITGEILRKFIGGKAKPSLAVLLVQKEVAQRIAAKDGKESILSISIKIYGEPEYVRKVPAGSFTPPPKVDSAVMAIKNLRNDFLSAQAEEKFFRVVKTGFAHKRKKLSGNLSAVFGKEKTIEALFSCGIPGNARAENLKPEDWVCLNKNLTLPVVGR